jgi:hypothetical protein
MRDDGAQPPITCCELSRPRNATERPGIVAGIQVIIGHHSNGQSTCLWVPGAPDDDTCVPPPGVPLLPVPNKVNGSFSTQFYRVSALYMKTYHDAELKPERSLSGWLAWEHHPIQFLGPPGITEALHSVYGPYRIQLGGELERFLPMTDCPKAYRMRNLGEPWAGMFRARVTAELIGGIAEALPPFILTAEAAWKPYRWNGLGVFARYYYGQDYYNYNFDRTLNIVQIGIVWDTNPLPPMAL